MPETALNALKTTLQENDLEGLRQLLQATPELANARPWQPRWHHTALESTAEGCVWHRPEKHRLCRLLVEFGAECDLQTAARAGLLILVKSKLRTDGGALNATDKQGRSALYRAACVYGAFSEGVAVADFLIEQGANVDLFTASALGMKDRVLDLLEHNPALATQRDPEGITALHWAVRPRRDPAMAQTIVAKLLNLGADVHATNPREDDMTPLHHATEWSAPTGVIDLLLQSGAPIDAPAAGSGWTPLVYALDRSRESAIQLLRSYDASRSDSPSDLA